MRHFGKILVRNTIEKMGRHGLLPLWMGFLERVTKRLQPRRDQGKRGDVLLGRSPCDPTKQRRIQPFCCALLACVLGACSTGYKKGESAEEAYKLAQEYEKDERYEDAVRNYQDVRNRFPYSNLATQAELALADVYFKQESYPEAQVAYEGFRELHPKHPKIDYVIFRTGLSHFMQLPETIDRDLSAAHSAIASFNEVLNNYSQSSYVTEAQKNKDAAQKMLLEKEIYIGDFYFKKDIFDSALTRYESALKDYPNLGKDPYLYKQLARTSLKLGQKEQALKFFDSLKKNHSDSREYDEVRRELKL